MDSYVPTENEILKSLNIINNLYPKFLILYKLMIESGCRFTELKDFIINFDKSKIEIYKQIVLYRNFYLRGQKSSYYLFFTKKTYEKLNLKELDVNLINSFQILSKRNKNIVTLKYLRKYHFTLMIENNVSFEIANFIQGRTSQNIGFNHYLAKKSIALKEYSKIIDKFGCC
ncbi:MAG: integrase [Candidatus Nanoarchaeia archaeon]|nr:integrase [Candidatus Nanoarchaeia archaeon]